MAIRTYYTTRVAGEVRRLDNLTLPWQDVSIPAGTDSLLDVMAFPQDPDKVIVVGRNRQIFKSIDAGVNWTAAGGDYPTTFGDEYQEIWIVDNLISYVTAETGGAILKSIDGGDNYNIIGYATPGGTQNTEKTVDALHFISPLIGIAFVGNSENKGEVWKTIDGGVTWTLLKIIVRSGKGCFLSDDEQTIVLIAANKVWKSTDGGSTFTDVYTTPDADVHLLNHLTWNPGGANMWAVGTQGLSIRSIDGGSTWTVLEAPVLGQAEIDAAHYYSSLDGFQGWDNAIDFTNDGGVTHANSESAGNPLSIWTEMPTPPMCYRLDPCDTTLDPILLDAQEGPGVDLMPVIGQVINLIATSTGEAPIGVSGCYTVTLQDSCGDEAPQWIVNSFTLVGSDCASFNLETCPTEMPVTLVGESTIVDITINNLSTETHDFVGSFGSCIASGMVILNPGITIAGGESGVMQVQYTPTLAEEGQCELIVTGPCGEIVCDICYHSVSVPTCSHFNICVTGPTCAPDCIKPGEVIQFNLGGNISPIAYPTVITFSVINQVTQEIAFAADYSVANDIELDAIMVNVPGLPPGKYCAEVCLPGCNAKRVLCFDVCEPFDIYKDSCNHWHVHRPGICQIEEYLVTVRPMECGGTEDAVVLDVLWDVSQDNTFEFEVPGDGIYIFEMKDPETGEVQYSFSAFETCKLQECFKIMMDKIMCSCADPCCKKCDQSPEIEREFSRMSLNKLVPLYFTYLGMARRNELYGVGMKLVTDDQLCFLHDACVVLAKINDIIMDCGCLCPEQENTATNRGDCQSC